jgi:adenylylsulfate kinase
MKKRKILIMGLPGSGKTYLAKKVSKTLKADWLNADQVRRKYNDWDFSTSGIIRQVHRMKKLADKSKKKFVVVDFICPLKIQLEIFRPNIIIWMDTIRKSKYPRINRIFSKPKRYDIRVTTQNADLWSNAVIDKVLGYNWNEKLPTIQMLGRFQPWHQGHRLLFEKALLKSGQVNIQVKNVWKLGDNPYGFNQIKKKILQDLQYFKKRIKISSLPNISEIIYGRKVGYKITKINLPKKIQRISGTNLRKKLRKIGKL